jgi:hypothetical protein
VGRGGALLAVLGGALVGAACRGDGGTGTERLTVAGAIVEVQPGADGRVQACLVAVPGVELPDWPLCVGPHTGKPGPAQAWASAYRAGGDVVVLVVLGAGDTMQDRRLVTVDAARHPVAVAVGVLEGYDAPNVCSTYRSGEVLSRFVIGIAVISDGEGGGVSTDQLGCTS